MNISVITKNRQRFHFISLLLVSMSIFMAYGNTFSSPFAFDDYGNVIEIPTLEIESLSINKLIDAAQSGPSGRRWLPNISFALNHYLHGDKVFGYHAVNLAIHLLCALTLYALAIKILTILPPAATAKSYDQDIALASTLVWALHPLQTNAVTYIVQRMTSMAAFFYLLALFCYIAARLQQSKNFRAVLFSTAACFGLMSLASKENSAVLPLTVLACEIYFLDGVNKLQGRTKIMLTVGILLCTLLISLLYLGPHPAEALLSGYSGRDFTLGQRLLTEGRVIFYYLSLLALPLPSRLNLNHDIIVSTGLFSPPQTLLAITGIIAMAWLCYYLFNRSRLLSFAVFWFFLHLVIESTVLPLELVFEHRLYLPSTILFLALIHELYRRKGNRLQLLRCGLIVAAMLLALLTWQRNKIWQSEISLWTDVISKSPNLVRGYGYRGKAYIRQGRYKPAEADFLKAVEIDPTDGRGYQNLGAIYAKQGQLQQAITSFTAAVPKKKTNLVLVHNNLGKIYLQIQQYAAALDEADKVLKIDPTNTDALLTKGIALEELGDQQGGFDQYRKAWLAGYDMVALHNRWAEEYLGGGERAKALAHLERALMLDPGNAAAQKNYAKALLLSPGTH